MLLLIAEYSRLARNIVFRTISAHCRCKISFFFHRIVKCTKHHFCYISKDLNVHIKSEYMLNFLVLTIFFSYSLHSKWFPDSASCARWSTKDCAHSFICLIICQNIELKQIADSSLGLRFPEFPERL